MFINLTPSRKSKEKIRICFFAHVYDKRILELVEFYNNDINILKELGFEVIIATKIWEIPLDCDLYYVWWWATGIQALLVARLLGKSIIMVGNVRYSKNVPPGFPHASRLKRLCLRASWHYATAILTTSVFEHNYVADYRKNSIYMVYHGINTERYKPGAESNRENLLFTICNLYSENAKRKRVKETIEAFALIARRYPDYKLVVAGGSAGYKDKIKEQLINITERLGIKNRVVFTGSISLAEKLRLYQIAKVFVQPSVYEGFGLAIAEAMACCTPVIVCRTSAIPEVVGDCGIYVSGTPESIAEGLVKLLDNETLRKNLASGAKQRIQEKFTYEKRKVAIGKIISEVLNQEMV